MRPLFRKKKSPGRIVWIIIRVIFVGFLVKYLFIPHMNDPDIFDNIGTIANIFSGSGGYYTPEDIARHKMKTEELVNTYQAEQEQARIANEKYKAEVDKYMNEEHPDPVIRDIEKQLLQKDKLTQADIANLEAARQQRINQLMSERGSNIINGFNQNPNSVNAPIVNQIQQEPSNKDTFINVIK